MFSQCEDALWKYVTARSMYFGVNVAPHLRERTFQMYTQFDKATAWIKVPDKTKFYNDIGD